MMITIEIDRRSVGDNYRRTEVFLNVDDEESRLEIGRRSRHSQEEDDREWEMRGSRKRCVKGE